MPVSAASGDGPPSSPPPSSCKITAGLTSGNPVLGKRKQERRVNSLPLGDT